jgi:hypothetical protein
MKGVPQGYPKVSASSGDPSQLLNKGLWNACNFASPSQWVEYDFGTAVTVDTLKLVVEQTPSGDTVHHVKGGDSPTALNQLTSVTGHTVNGQKLKVNLNSPKIRYLRIETVQSPSWVAWREIKIKTKK